MSRNILLITLTLLIVLLIGAFFYYLYALPVMRTGPQQPIPFSHNVHVAVKEIQCQFCHPYVAYSDFPGIPPVEKCLYCHKYIIAGHPEILKEHRYFDTETPTPWVKVNYVPEHVLFNHQRHINNKIACQECHGQVQNLQRLPYKDWRMAECIQCHRKKNANIGCWLACHS
ncbi:MAG: cytochrome c3 family protein [Deltaproteobacteria bacterium]